MLYGYDGCWGWSEDVWLAGDVMLEVGVILLRRLLGLEGGCVASRGSDTGRQVSRE